MLIRFGRLLHMQVESHGRGQGAIGCRISGGRANDLERPIVDCRLCLAQAGRSTAAVEARHADVEKCQGGIERGVDHQRLFTL